MTTKSTACHHARILTGEENEFRGDAGAWNCRTYLLFLLQRSQPRDTIARTVAPVSANIEYNFHWEQQSRQIGRPSAKFAPTVAPLPAAQALKCIHAGVAALRSAREALLNKPISASSP